MIPETLADHWIWLILALTLGIAEMVVPGAFLIWLGAAAAVTGVLTLLFGLPLAAQFFIFALAAIAAVYAGRRFFRDNPIATTDPLLNERTARLIGEVVLVTDAIQGGRGRVQVGDSVWPAKGPDMASGVRVRVVGAQGNTLLVEPA